MAIDRIFVRRKGFVYTLESIIASSLVLGIILVVMPNIQLGPQLDMGEIESGLESLDKRGELREDLSHEAIESKLEPYVPRDYSHSVRVIYTETMSRDVNAPESFNLDGDGDYFELQVWLENPSDMNVSFDGETLVSNQNSPNYFRQRIDGTGTLEFEGSGDASFEFDSYRSDGSFTQRDRSFSTDYLLDEDGEKEIQVIVWQE